MTAAALALKQIHSLKRELERVASVLSSPVAIPDADVEVVSSSVLSCHGSVSDLFVIATREYLLTNYIYDAEDGHFYRSQDIGIFKKGSRVGVKNRFGYWQINGKPDDNRIANLRLATRSENSQNAAPQRNSFSKFKGIYLHKPTGKWLARIKKNGVRKNLGLHDTAEAASDAYIKASREIFGEFAFVNRPVDDNKESGDR
ncbi:hypothetical protein GGQ73_004695 [Rhizobium skierniewicense]|uniref:AP2/ERF domain-containing protein n=1 Tax=Rhizobium skierniewicense TaxID=984260 RepID=A0A7W6CFZ8_9HYPH|nr:AP2 domain-containing protein [Rhizobium skierniewicense]MBB3948704.1 hypothetical protein [Rhizobium skierniewicense]